MPARWNILKVPTLSFDQIECCSNIPMTTAPQGVVIWYLFGILPRCNIFERLRIYRRHVLNCTDLHCIRILRFSIRAGQFMRYFKRISCRQQTFPHNDGPTQNPTPTRDGARRFDLQSQVSFGFFGSILFTSPTNVVDRRRKWCPRL